NVKGNILWVWSAAFSSDGRRIVTANEGGGEDATVWDADNGKKLLSLKGHRPWVFSAVFSPDARRIVTGSDDHTAKVWDAVTGEPLLILKGHSGGIMSV